MTLNKMNKRGALEDIFIWIIVGFVFAILGAAFLFGFGLLTNSLISIDTGNPNINVSDAATITFGNINDGLQQIRWWTFGIVFGLFISIFISNFLTKVNPVYFIFYVIVAIIAIIVSMIISNAYEVLYLSDTFLGSELAKQVGTSWIYLNLPIWTTVLALIGGVFQFISFSRSGDGGSFI